ncbi:hypothetical protein GW17_00004745 [Ensete ventricosum]|nr:hypothetical protein GW17_00004745 [Ensete ventricosum]
MKGTTTRYAKGSESKLTHSAFRERHRRRRRPIRRGRGHACRSWEVGGNSRWAETLDRGRKAAGEKKRKSLARAILFFPSNGMGGNKRGTRKLVFIRRKRPPLLHRRVCFALRLRLMPRQHWWVSRARIKSGSDPFFETNASFPLSGYARAYLTIYWSVSRERRQSRRPIAGPVVRSPEEQAIAGDWVVRFVPGSGFRFPFCSFSVEI